jgi:AcrR family transcriptional regulator
MPRVRADDYDAKSQAILDSAAALFAKVGYPNAKMQDIAKACGASKSMLYHYFPTKDDLLFAMLEEHLEKVIAGIEEVRALPGSNKDRFSAFVQVYAQKSVQSRRRHVAAMNDVKFLPKSLQTPLRELETKVTNVVAEMLREQNPNLAEGSYKPYAMLLIGMLNWTDTWYRPGGAIKPQELCERISRLFLRGFLAEKASD